MSRLMIRSLVVLGGLLVGVLVVSALSVKPQASHQGFSEPQIGQAWAYASPTSEPTVILYGLAFTEAYFNCAKEYFKTHSEPASFKDVLLSPVVQERCNRNG